MMNGLYVIIILVVIVIILSMIKPIISLLFKGLKWIISLALEFVLFSVISFFILGKNILVLSLAATIVLNIIIVVRKIKNRNKYDDIGYYSSGYVLNKKSGVIHERWSDTASTIKDNHRVDISSYDANRLVSRGKKYRFKK